MYSNITLKKNRQHLGSVLMAFVFLCVINITAFAQPYINGPFSTGATAGGTPAPAGYTWSELPVGALNFGFAASVAAGITCADDFTVPVGQTWNVTKITFYAYSTGWAGAGSPFTDTRVQIFNTNPSVGAPTPVFGNLTTNRFLASSTANVYRIANATAATNREVWKVEATVVTSLTAGTYWVEWQHGTTAASNFSPPKTIAGQLTQAGNNAQQRTIAGNTWAALLDGTNAQDMPFRIDYTPTGSPCTAVSPGATTATPAVVCPGINFNLSVATPGSGIGLSYQWERSPDNIAPYVAIPTATSATLSTSQTAATWYRLRVTCGANPPLTSTPVQVTMSTNCYCVPSAINCAFSDVITNVTFAGINNTSACSTTGGYTNFTSLPAGMPLQGAANPMSVTVGPGGTEFVGVWIDYNQNGVFETTEFTALGSGNGVTISNNIVIPATALLGPTRMRVRVQWNAAVLPTHSCIPSGGFGEVEDYNVNIIPCVPVSITTQPADATAVCGANVTFTTAVAGSLPTYTWQYRTSATSPWLTVPNAAPYSNVTGAALTVAANSSLTGYQFRALVSGACSGLNNTNIATLTVTPLVLNVTPAIANYCAPSGTPVLLTVPNTQVTACFNNVYATGVIPTGTGAGAAGTLIVPDGPLAGISSNIVVAGIPVGATILDIKVKINMKHTYVGDMLFNLKSPTSTATTGIVNLVGFLNGGTGTNATENFVNTVVASNGVTAMSGAPAPRTGTYKADLFLTPGLPSGGGAANVNNWATVLSTPNANGTWVLYMVDGGAGDIGYLYDWQLCITYGSTPATAVFSPLAGLFTNAAATIPYTGTAVGQVYAAPTTNTTYSAVVTAGLCNTAAQSIVVNANTSVGGTATLANQTTCNSKNATFVLGGALTGGPGFTHNYQVSTNGGATFTNLANGGVYSGATTNTLVITGATFAMNGFQYRDSINTGGGCGFLKSTVGTLTVNPTPVVTISASPVTKLFPGLTSTLTAAVSPTPGATTTYQWLRDGVPVTGATGLRHIVNIDGLGAYTVNVTDANGCASAGTTPASITISDSATNNILFIYPSPNSGRFQVRYYFDAQTANTTGTFVNIYDEKGARVFTRPFNPGFGYGQMNVDLGAHGTGVYRVDLLNANGERLKTGSVMVF